VRKLDFGYAVMEKSFSELPDDCVLHVLCNLPLKDIFECSPSSWRLSRCARAALQLFTSITIHDQRTPLHGNHVETKPTLHTVRLLLQAHNPTMVRTMTLSPHLLPDHVDLVQPLRPNELVIDPESRYYAERGRFNWLNLQDILTFSTSRRFGGLIRDMPKLQHLTMYRLSDGDDHYEGGDNGHAKAIARACPTLEALSVPHPGMLITADTLAFILRACPQLTSLQEMDYESGMLAVLTDTPMQGSLEIHLKPDLNRSGMMSRVLSDLTAFVSAPGFFSGKLDMTSKALWSRPEECEAWNKEVARLAERASFHLDAKVSRIKINISDNELLMGELLMDDE